MKIERIENGAFAANCYLLFNDDRKTLVIDPGADAPRILDRIRDLELEVVGYPLTHGHIDHIGALNELRRIHPAPVGLHANDARWAFTVGNGWPPYYEPVLEVPEIAVSYQEGQPVLFGPFQFDILETPGHSPGGVCFLFENEKVLISGDTLFAGSMGRVDLPGSNPAEMKESLKKLNALKTDYRVYPGHGEDTLLSIEKRSNPYLQGFA